MFNTEVANFSVVEAEGALDCVMAPIAAAGTETDSSKTNSVKIVNDAVLTHGSVNHNDGKAYIINPEGSPKYLDRGLNNAGNWKYKDDTKIYNNSDPAVQRTVDVYVAVAWTMTFSYSFKSETANVGIYLDVNASEFGNETGEFTAPGSGTNSSKDTAKGFRIAFMSASTNVVWGNNTLAGGQTDSKNYVSSATGEAAYTAHDETDAEHIVKGDYIPESATGDRYVDNTATSGTKCKPTDLERICTLTTTTSSVTVTCAAWFEGTDPNIVTGAAMKCLSASMVFYARSDAAE